MGDSFYVTTPIYYPNGVPHIGHAYNAIASDVVARFMRLDGRDVFFLTGTDEHGLKMKQTAVAEGLTPIALADRNSARFRAMMTALDVSYDDYIRTTEPRHAVAAQEIWRRMAAAGDIALGTYGGWYSVRQEAYFDEGETTVGEDGVRREPLGSPVEWTQEETYFFRLSAYADRLLAHYDANPDFIRPDARRNEVTSFVRSGLRDLAISRGTLDWGIPVPGDPKHVMYVWVDALTNYLTATGWPGEGPRARFWPADLHCIGKDILRFHAVYWPAFLLSAGLPLPKRLFAHGFVLNRGEKMSKSVGNVVDPFDLVTRYGVDQVRYFLMREVAFGQDGVYSHEAIVARTNADLANDLGNLAQRSLSMVAKNLDGVLPGPGPLAPAEQALLAAADALHGKARAAMADLAIHAMLADVWAVVAEANRVFAAAEPWALRKSDPERFGAVLWLTAEVLRQVAILAQPVTPAAAGKLLDLLGVDADARGFDRLGAAGRLAGGTSLPAPSGIFPRHVEPAEASA